MTEAEWLACADPKPMLEFLREKVSERKLRLFVCACARLVWDRFPDGLFREAVEAGEKRADGLISDEARQEFIHRFYAPWGKPYRPATWFGGTPWAEKTQDDLNAFFTAKLSVAPGTVLAELPAGLGWARTAQLTGQRQPRLLLDIFGNIFRPVIRDPAWLTPGVMARAQAAYEERLFPNGEIDPQRLSVLADALEEVGASEEILSHLRSPGPHVRGCWAVDLCLGKA